MTTSALTRTLYCCAKPAADWDSPSSASANSPTTPRRTISSCSNANKRSVARKATLVIVESDVFVTPETLVCLKAEAGARPDSGIVAAVTTDEEGRINYPYLYAKRKKGKNLDTRRHLSFCCSLLTPQLLEKVDFQNLDSSKDWFDVTISHLSLEAGLHNWLLCTLPVVHKPHQSRPWKQLKYKNPLLYYWRKFTHGFDKI